VQAKLAPNHAEAMTSGYLAFDAFISRNRTRHCVGTLKAKTICSYLTIRTEGLHPASSNVSSISCLASFRSTGRDPLSARYSFSSGSAGCERRSYEVCVLFRFRTKTLVMPQNKAN
jgi:hypothetical protein